MIFDFKGERLSLDKEYDKIFFKYGNEKIEMVELMGQKLIAVGILEDSIVVDTKRFRSVITGSSPDWSYDVKERN